MVKFGVKGQLFDFPDPKQDCTMPECNDAGIKEIRDQWKIADDLGFASYNPGLKIHGLTKPEQNPEIGPPAFESFLNPPSGIPVDLDPFMTRFQVALTVAHELTHAAQYDMFCRISLDDKQVGDGGVSLQEQGKLQAALERERAIFETLGYQTEVLNMHLFKYSRQGQQMSPIQLEQWEALMDVAVQQRDYFFKAITVGIQSQSEADDMRTLFPQGEINALLSKNQAGIPREYIEDPGLIIPSLSELEFGDHLLSNDPTKIEESGYEYSASDEDSSDTDQKKGQFGRQPLSRRPSLATRRVNSGASMTGQEINSSSSSDDGGTSTAVPSRRTSSFMLSQSTELPPKKEEKD